VYLLATPLWPGNGRRGRKKGGEKIVKKDIVLVVHDTTGILIPWVGKRRKNFD